MLSPRSRAIAGAGTRLLLSDPAPLLVTIVMPLLLIAFLMPATRAQLRAEGYPHATGGEQLVPGLAVMFLFLGAGLVGTLFFREHAWGTWDRLRASPASTLDIVVGKTFPLYLGQLAQLAILFVAGRLLFGYRPTGSVPALVIVLALFDAMVVAFAVMLVAVFSTMDQALVIGNLGGMVMAGLGGALAPASSLDARRAPRHHAERGRAGPGRPGAAGDRRVHGRVRARRRFPLPPVRHEDRNHLTPLAQLRGSSGLPSGSDDYFPEVVALNGGP